MRFQNENLISFTTIRQVKGQTAHQIIHNTLPPIF